MNSNEEREFHMKNLETYKSRCDDAINAFSNAMKTLEPYCNRYSREFFSSPLGIANSLLGKFVDIGKGVDEKVCFLMGLIYGSILLQNPDFDNLKTLSGSARQLQLQVFNKMVIKN
ncbi:hypothetical protein B9Z55_025102 [Caenorhabditis nigoni]|uniref:Uncharacterized protein n=1 Tax=Caenorhabditis nigoni TaxID=1611254 RepID=A0A2G5SXN4_9PELO|nr:hypothetical protein B9Z55_025102 [Caenorhabditis nigoni]